MYSVINSKYLNEIDTHMAIFKFIFQSKIDYLPIEKLES